MGTKLRSRFTLLFVAFAMLLAVPAIALADVIVADGDTVTAGAQGSRNLGTVQPGATVTPAVDFYLRCDTKQHFNSNDSANINFTGSTIKDANNVTPATGSANATSLTDVKGPQNNWPADDIACPTDISDRLLGSSTATIVAPKKAGTYTVQLDYSVNQGPDTTNQEIKNNITNDPLTFTLTVPNAAPVINTFSGDASATEGQTKSYTVSATDANDDTLSYGLQKSSTGGANVNITAGATAGSFNVKFETPGSVDLQASARDAANTTTQTRTVSVASACTVPSVTTQPANQPITYGADASFTAAASGTSPSVQWQVNDGTGWTNISAATSGTLTLTKPPVSDSGKQYRAVFSNGCGSATSNAATLTVSKATADVQLNNLGPYTYDGTVKAASASTTPTGLNVDLAYSQDGSPATPKNAGSYAVVATVNNANYEGRTTGTLVINKAQATINLSGLSKTYNGSPQGATVTTTPDTPDAQLTVTYDGREQAPTNAGSYAVVASLNDANYQARDATDTLVIAKAKADVTLSNLTQTYDGTVKAASATTDPANLNVDLAYSQDGLAATPKNAGDYRVVATVNNANYQGSASGTLSIARADQAISFGALANKTFGDANFNVSATGGASGNDVTFKALDKCTVVGNTVQITGAGICTVTASQAGNTNYNAATDVSHSFRIAKATTTTTLTCGVGPFTYDGSAQTPCEATVKGFNLNAPVTVDYENNVNAGTATASASYAGAANYEPSSSGQKSFTIEKRAITVTADAQSKTYGEADPALTYKVTSGSLANANDLSGSLTRVAGQDVGTYAIQQGSLAGSGNYQITFVGANLTIEKRAITVTADAQSKTYGEADPALTYQVGGRGLVNGDSLSGSLDRAAGENFGTYAIRQGTLAASNNYSLTYVGANLTIGKAPITLKANDASRYYDDPNPAFGYSIVAGSFKNGDLGNGVSVELNTLATATSQAGSTHNITVALSGAKASNYSLTAQNGTLTILGWTNKGFFAPVDYGTTQNTVKNGSTVPLKFQVFKGTQQLTSTNIVSGLKPSVTNCQTGVPVDDIEELATGGTSLRYDATAGQFIFNWQTPKKPGTCYSVTVQMVDGTTVPVAKFWLK